MKKLLVLLLTLSFTAMSQEMTVVEEGLVLKLAKVEFKTKCTEIYDNDPGTDARYNCKIGNVLSQLKKRFNGFVEVKAMDSSSRDVLTNLVDRSGEYTFRLLVSYYE